MAKANSNTEENDKRAVRRFALRLQVSVKYGE